MMKPLHPWKVTPEQAIRIQETLRDRIILKKSFSRVRTIGGGDVSYHKEGDFLFGAMVVLIRISSLSLILFQISLKPVHPLFDVLHGIGITKPEVALCIAPEIDSRCHPDLRLHKDIEG